MDNYFGKYAIATPASKEEAAKLLNSDNVIGDIYDVICTQEDGHRAYVLNRFNDKPAYFNKDDSRTLAVNEAAGMVSKAILTLVGFTEGAGNETNYWAQFALISYPKSKEEIYKNYVAKVSDSIKHDRRPEVALSAAEVRELEDANGHWRSDKVVPLPEKKKGTAFIKTHVSLSDKMVEEGRKNNPGCYIFGWAGLLAVVGLFVLLIAKIIGF